MSIINKVLNDLDKRNQPGAGNLGHGSAVAAPSSRRGVIILLIVLTAIIVAGAVAYALWQPSTVHQEATAEEPPVQQPAADTTAEESAEQSAEESTESRMATQVKSEATTATAQVLRDDQQQSPVTSEAAPVTTAPTDHKVVAAESQRPQELTQAPQQQAPQKVAADAEPRPAQQTPSASSFSKQPVTLSQQEIVQRALQKAEQAERQGLFSEAASHYAAALAAQPDNHNIRKSWAALEYGRGQMTQALSILREGLDQYPQQHSLRLLAASMLEKQADVSLALQLLKQQQPDAAKLPQYYQLQAMLAQRLGDDEAMRQSYRALVTAQPENGRWRLGLALALRDHNPQQALAEFEQAAVLIQHAPTRQFIAEQIKQLRSQHATSTP